MWPVYYVRKYLDVIIAVMSHTIAEIKEISLALTNFCVVLDDPVVFILRDSVISDVSGTFFCVVLMFRQQRFIDVIMRPSHF